MGMFRPSKTEIDALEDLGAKGWNWESLLYYMKKVKSAPYFQGYDSPHTNHLTERNLSTQRYSRRRSTQVRSEA